MPKTVKKVSFEQVKEIRRLYESENVRIADLARRFNLPRPTVRHFVEYETRVES